MNKQKIGEKVSRSRRSLLESHRRRERERKGKNKSAGDLNVSDKNK